MRTNLRNLAITLVAGAAACSGGGGGSPYSSNNTPTSPTGNTGNTTAPNTIEATTGLAFVPSSLTVAVGTNVTFVFDATTHNVTFSTSGAPANIPNSANTSVQRTFSTAGTYQFACTIHPYMMGMVIVQ